MKAFPLTRLIDRGAGVFLVLLGAERAHLVFGWIFAGHQIGAAMAAFAAGLSRTMLATYLPAFFADRGLHRLGHAEGMRAARFTEAANERVVFRL